MRYFFHLSDGSRVPDEVGTELPDDAAARLHAVKYAGDVLQREPALLEDEDIRVEVADQSGLVLFTVIVLVVTAAVTGSMRRKPK
ncbi:DUF6894 family protein [Sphingomonas mucosissima]|uniref:DUF6894 domain-containing protein n=1 Tax=Sphingomonas mucosissima TaxID=370959 RepID=A0A245ZRE2_9SPHN|nr:hypothetical protein [Sphingomonas mucosissima]OWK32312.1 hypothetical protein SPMU_06340 [Sphingomonas mucosissima]